MQGNRERRDQAVVEVTCAGSRPSLPLRAALDDARRHPRRQPTTAEASDWSDTEAAAVAAAAVVVVVAVVVVAVPPTFFTPSWRC